MGQNSYNSVTMKLLILAVLLSLAQAAPPAPRKTPDHSARSSQNVKREANGTQSRAASSTPVPDVAGANKDQNASSTPANANAQETIFITEAAAVPIQKDRWDKAYVILTGLLVIIGALGVRSAIRSLGLIERQARANEDTLAEIKASSEQTDRLIKHASEQAEAAQESLDLSRDTAVRQLRAYVCVASGIVRFKIPTVPVAEIHIKNYGQTPAYDVRMWIGTAIAAYPLKETLPTPKEGFQMATVILAPNEKPHVLKHPHTGIPSELLLMIGLREFTLYIYGEIRYKDAFGLERLTKYRYLYGGAGPLNKTVEDGTPCRLIQPDIEGNEAT